MLSFKVKVPRDQLFNKNKSTFSLVSNQKTEDEIIQNTTQVSQIRVQSKQEFK
jgi:hypothetical protein